MRAPDALMGVSGGWVGRGGGGCPFLVSILRMAVCLVSLAQSLCRCLTNKRTRNLFNYTSAMLYFTELYVSAYIALDNSWLKHIVP